MSPLFRQWFTGLSVIALLVTSTPPSGAAQTSATYSRMVLDETHGRIYAIDLVSQNVSVLAVTTLGVVETIPLGSAPAGLDVAPDGSELAVALPNVNELAFVNLQNTATITHVTVPTGGSTIPNPYDVKYGRAGRLYVANGADPQQMVVFDTQTHTPITQASWYGVERARLALTPDRNALYVGQGGWLERVDISTDAITRTAQATYNTIGVGGLCVLDNTRIATSGGQIVQADLGANLLQVTEWGFDLACSPTGDRIYLSRAPFIYAFDTTTGELLWSFDFKTNLGALQINATGDHLYVSTSLGVKALGTDVRPRVYLPALHAPKFGIFGRVTLNNAPLPNVGLSLSRRSTNGNMWTTYATTGSDGSYLFSNPPTLSAGQWYVIEYQSGEFANPDHVYRWTLPDITQFTYGGSLDVGSFDVANITHVAPAQLSVVRLPQTFQWTTRDAFPDETYEFAVYDPADQDPWFAVNVGHEDRYTLQTLPLTFGLNTPYYWTARIHSANGGLGLMHFVYTVQFLDRGAPAFFGLDPRADAIGWSRGP